MKSGRSFYTNVLYAENTVTSGRRKSIGLSKSSPNLLALPSDSGSQVRNRCVSGSLSSITDSFFKSVEKMVSAVLIPTRLLDIPVKDDPMVPELVTAGHSNMYEVFKSIQEFKEKLQSMTVTQADLETLTAFEVEDIISNFKRSQHQNLRKKSLSVCDLAESGFWSSHASTVADSEALGSLTHVSAAEFSLGECSRRVSESEDSDETSPTSSFVVKRTFKSAKGLCAFLHELSNVTNYVIKKYMEEMDCSDN